MFDTPRFQSGHLPVTILSHLLQYLMVRPVSGSVAGRGIERWNWWQDKVQVVSPLFAASRTPVWFARTSEEEATTAAPSASCEWFDVRGVSTEADVTYSLWYRRMHCTGLERKCIKAAREHLLSVPFPLRYGDEIGCFHQQGLSF